MNLTQTAFHYRKLVFMLVGLLLVNGIVAYFTLPSQEDPTITIREATVNTHFPGMSPERVEKLITKTLEEEIRKIPEVEKIRSTSSTGQSLIHVEVYDRYFNLDAIWQNLRNKVAAAESQLPEGTHKPIVNDEFGDVSVITLALTADGFEMSQMFDISKHVRDTLYTVEGTKKVDILGVQDERIFLEVSNARLAQLGIPPKAIISALQTQNIVRPGGQVDTGKKAYVVEPTGNFDSVDDIGNTLIAIPGSQDVIPLKDIVEIRRDYVDPPQRLAYFNGKQSVIFAISMLPGYNVLEFSPRVVEKVSEVENTLPIGYQLDYATFQADQVKQTVYGVSMNVLQTLVIVLVVVVLFLGMRTGLIVGTIVPLVMLVTLSLMQFGGLALERMSLATLIISLGLLVDNGIVIAEDFKRRLEQGESREQALKSCGKELAIPLFSSSLTTILVFLPLMLAQHVAGEYTRTISLVILITLLSSWVLALCVTPTLCYFFIKVERQPKNNLSKEGSDEIEEKVAARGYLLYRKFLLWILHHRLMFVSGMFLLLFASFYSMKFVPNQFFPDSDRMQILINVDLPADVSARQTDATMRKIFQFIENKQMFPEIESYSGYVGFGGPRFVLSLSPDDPADNKGFIVLNLNNTANIGPLIDKLYRNLMEQFPDIFVRVKKMFLGPSDSSVLQIQVKGPDADILYAKAEQIVDMFHQIPGTIDIRQDWEQIITNVVVKVDQKRARRAGVTSQDIAQALEGYFSGAAITEYREQDDIIPIIFRAEVAERFNLDRLRTIGVYSETRGVAIPLFQIADFEPDNQYAKIQRENMFRTISIEARNTAMTAEDLKSVVNARLEELKTDLPVNHQIEYDGVIVQSAEAQQALSANMPLVIGAIIILLVAQFNSFRKPLIIVMTIPLSFIGAVVGLLVMNAPFGFMVTLGLYSLAGIIVNNAIVLIDRFELEIAAGKKPFDAIVDSCITRLRPITMTTITTMLGLLPLIISQDPLFYGMANVIAFGLGVGTVLTLGIVPVLYSIFYQVERPEATA
ncbi:efflux RND transporter permease subunit [Aliikangiella sp. G2MR2-5]|uniref:efflux RND transporter permease subunit n=1 Tax=Aliikangiella sp. G2MR2-5 TaxID=2788943 RepID=UPI0018A8E830|nr:efflux RND transporter permease subunit [Aliikangiella sp. G2MR2-5]